MKSIAKQVGMEVKMDGMAFESGKTCIFLAEIFGGK